MEPKVKHYLDKLQALRVEAAKDELHIVPRLDVTPTGIKPVFSIIPFSAEEKLNKKLEEEQSNPQANADQTEDDGQPQE